MDENVIEEPEGRETVRFDWLRHRREPLWVVGVIITLPLTAMIILFILRLAGMQF